MPNLAEMPMVPVHVADVDNLYNVLDWQRVGSKAMIRHYLGFPSIFSTTLEQSRYFHVPVGNLPSDTTSFGADLFYARHLQKHNCVLWCSPTVRPDLGGHEFDDNRLVAELEESSLVTEINNPGCYEGVCIELDIEALAVTTLLQSSQINETEGTSASIAFDAMPQMSVQDMIGGATETSLTSLTSYDETARCATAFRILKQMVTAWLRDVTQYRNVFADLQISHFYRWLRDPSSLLHDPALRRTLHSLINRLFLHLVAEFKRLGSLIVFANFNKLIICTKKRTVSDAITYTNYIVEAIRSKELFHSIDLGFRQCWLYLSWLDPSNHGGIKGKVPDEGLDGSLATEAVAEDEEEVIDMNWSLAEHLPEWCGARRSFTQVVANYVGAVWGSVAEGGGEVRRRALTPATPDPNLPSPSPASPQKDPLAPPHVAFARTLIQGQLSQKLFRITQEIQKRANKGRREEEEESSHSLLVPAVAEALRKTPALEFVKCVCKVLSLDTNVADQVHKLRRDLLKLVGVGEFSPEGRWAEPCLSYTLLELICRACNHCRNLDLCRDDHQQFQDGAWVWLCPVCQTPYDTAEVEQQLVAVLNNTSLAHALQDLVCRSCDQVKQSNMSATCECGGDFGPLLPASALRERSEVFRAIATHYGMPLLLDAVQWLMASNRWH